MAKVITLARTFMKGHPRAGDPTYFVEKVLNSLGIDYHSEAYLLMLWELNPKIKEEAIASFFMGLGLLNDTSDEKPHTIRNGHRWKDGDMASLRVWSGKPYNSPQIIIAPDVEIKKVYDFNIDGFKFILNRKLLYHQHVSTWHSHMEKLCSNDGLNFCDFLDWFKVPSKFDGQIICWKDPGY